MRAVARACRLVTIVVLATTAFGCGGSARTAAGTHVQMEAMTSALSARCHSSRVLGPACPALIPKVAGRLTVDENYVRANGFAVFDLQHGAPHERRTRLNRPPTVLHLTIVAGPTPSNLFGGMAYPGSQRTARLGDGLDVGTRRRTLLFGSRRWGGHVGSLFLAPSYPFGGQLGGHLTFWWRSGGTGYVISLHAWEPLAECARVLQAVVASTD
jgi:hypothetical protein